ncbi:peroxiredoxin [Candidatus Kaiserbacteria bacterium CG10_big_fil_rev_8_21_14_0_10_49_17]|uniref:Glutathione-dependent peroxiredoxin n=1 Tax=Candidatus Kaiserbacteria bacterium CG10_big_fil_rev_8_21_14_0_10_49_17 TaxID=1974609 RepID=A0A2M6WFA7_9BACT|nr:MAG: peroxiredoxin [Candidatus Kaiserbacteria bacterium CG10_big_fil_rev_8_21_14_0_10_49_17]
MDTPTLEGKKIPSVTLKTRVNGEWKEVSTDEIFGGKKVVIFSLPGAFTPTCSSTHLPGFDAKYDEIKAAGVDEVYCISVNDAYVMNAWGKDLGIKNVKLLPDGSGAVTRGLGMMVKKDNLGFGERSWRFSAYVEDGEIKKAFIEPGYSDNCEDDPFEVSDADTMLAYLKNK